MLRKYIITVCFSSFFSFSTNIYDLASILASLCFVFMMLFSGFLVRVADIPDWLHWLKDFSIFKYGLANLQINELRGMTFTGCGHHRNVTCEVTGDLYLETQDVEATMMTVWTNIAALGGITTVLLVLSYVQLRRIKTFT